MSYPQITRELGRKDHTTAMHSINKIEKQLKFDAMIREKVNDIKDRLYA